MPNLRRPVKELLTPAPDGIETDFQTSVPFKSGTVSIWINGMRRLKHWDDGFDEVDAEAGIIRMKEAPEVDDSVQAEYDPA